MEEENYTLGEMVKMLRTEQKLTLSGLSLASGVSASTISRLERGNLHVQIGKIQKIILALGYEIRIKFANAGLRYS
jgi:transcriptional regulator with XRE-family HTH domain